MFKHISNNESAVNLLESFHFNIELLNKEGVATIISDNNFLLILSFFENKQMNVHIFKVEDYSTNLDGLNSLLIFFQEVVAEKVNENDSLYKSCLLMVKHTIATVEARALWYKAFENNAN